MVLKNVSRTFNRVVLADDRRIRGGSKSKKRDTGAVIEQISGDLRRIGDQLEGIQDVIRYQVSTWFPPGYRLLTAKNRLDPIVYDDEFEGLSDEEERSRSGSPSGSAASGNGEGEGEGSAAPA